MTKRFFIISLILLGLASITFGQKTVSPAKKKLVADLTAKTSAIFPAETIDTLFKDVQAERMAETAKGITDSLVAKIDSNNKLTAQEKDEIKSKIPALSKKLAELSMNFIGKDFTIQNWVNESFQKYYSTKFTTTELRQLNTYFQSGNGKQVVQIFKTQIIGGITDDKKTSNAKDDALMENFLKKSFAQKFFNVLLENILEEVMQKTDAWGKKALRELDKSLDNGEMKRLLEDFIITNIKA